MLHKTYLAETISVALANHYKDDYNKGYIYHETTKIKHQLKIRNKNTLDIRKNNSLSRHLILYILVPD